MNPFEYNHLSLQPKDEHEKKLFKKFRTQDVKEQFGYFVFLVGALVVVMIFNFLRTLELTEGIALMDGLF